MSWHMPCPWTCVYFSFFLYHHVSIPPPSLCPWRVNLLIRYLFDSYLCTITKTYDCYLRTYSSLFSYLWYDVFITYTLCLVLSCLVYDSFLLILPLTHLTHLPSMRHVGLSTSSDSLTLISDLSLRLVPLILTCYVLTGTHCLAWAQGICGFKGSVVQCFSGFRRGLDDQVETEDERSQRRSMESMDCQSKTKTKLRSKEDTCYSLYTQGLYSMSQRPWRVTIKGTSHENKSEIRTNESG